MSMYFMTIRRIRRADDNGEQPDGDNVEVRALHGIWGWRCQAFDVGAGKDDELARKPGFTYNVGTVGKYHVAKVFEIRSPRWGWRACLGVG